MREFSNLSHYASFTSEYFVFVPDCTGGQIGFSWCPGRHSTNSAAPTCEQKLASDLQIIQSWQPALILSLLEKRERMQLTHIGFEKQCSCVFNYLSIPVPDMATPGLSFHRAWNSNKAQIDFALNSGKRVFVHCWGGLGRSGMVSAALISQRGYCPKQAIAMVRSVRPGAIETKEQEDWVVNHATEL